MNQNIYENAPRSIKDYISYMKTVLSRSDLTVKNYYTDIRSLFRYYKVKKGRASDDADNFSKIDISDITDEDIKSVDLQLVLDFLAFMKDERNVGAKARYRMGVSLRQFYLYLTKKKNMFEVTPLVNLDLTAPKNANPKYLTFEQALEMLSAVESSDQKRDYCIVVFFLNTGMRLSELVGINLKSIISTKDRDGNMLYSVKVLGKGSKERIIPLNNACVSAYLDYLAPDNTDPESRNAAGCRDMSAQSDALFLSRRKKRISNRRVQQIIEDCFVRSGLENYGFSVHKLRHTAATLMFQNGVDVRVLKDFLGHENLNTTQIYTHVVPVQVEEAVKHNPLSNVKPNEKK